MKQHCYDIYALQAFVDNQLTPAEYEAVSRHLASCPRCRALAAELQAVSLPLRECPPLSPPADLHERLTAAVANHSPLVAISCEKALEMASAAVDGELAAEESGLLEAHLDGCAHCARIAAEFAAMSRALQETTPAQVPADLLDRIRTAVSPSRPVETGVVHLFKRVRWITVGAAAAAALLVALFIGLPGSGPEYITPTAPSVVVQAPEPAAPDIAEVPAETAAPAAEQETTVAAEATTAAPADIPAARSATPQAQPSAPGASRRERIAREPASPRPAAAAVTTTAPAPARTIPAPPPAVAAAPAPPAVVAAPSPQPDLAVATDRRQPVRTARIPRLDGAPLPGSSATPTETAVALAPPSRALAETVRTTTPSAQSPGATLEKASPGPETAARPATLDKKPRTSYVARTEREHEIYRSDDNSTHLVAMGSKVKRDLEIAARSEPKELLILR